jgi:glycosyltransferase involved in cell wall biosynthesis
MPKLIIQIPCFNEADQIEACLKSLPGSLTGMDSIETLVIDDGSGDDTAARARAGGARHVLSLGRHVGLAGAFSQGLEYAFQTLGADFVINFDADRQYESSDIPLLLAPLLMGDADYVLGARPINAIPHFSFIKKCLQRLGSAFISGMSGLCIPDATTGFRAMNRTAGLRFSVWTAYSYTLETLLQAAELKLRVKSVPIRVRAEAPMRPSRLFNSPWDYCWHSFKTVLMTIVRYRPFSTFILLSGVSFLFSVAVGARFIWYNLHGHSGMVQSLILCAIFAVASLSLFLASILGEAISINRRLLEQLRFDQRSKHG